jgi:protein-disulfide isomerase
MVSKRFALILAILVILFGGFLIFGKKDANAPSGSSSGTKPSNHVIGGGKSGVVLAEYGDFQCPACYAYEPTVQQLREKYKDQITFQFRHFPLIQIHKNAMAASRAAEAAGLQGKFWEMHDKLYETQDPEGKTGWVASSDPSSFFEEIAKELNLDITKFKADMNSATVNSTINADIKAGEELGADSTPTFVLDGKKIEQNPRDLESFSKLIDEAIKAKTGQ